MLPVVLLLWLPVARRVRPYLPSGSGVPSVELLIRLVSIPRVKCFGHSLGDANHHIVHVSNVVYLDLPVVEVRTHRYAAVNWLKLSITTP